MSRSATSRDRRMTGVENGMRVALGQMVVGPDKDQNLRTIARITAGAAAAGARLVVFPEGAMVQAQQSDQSLVPVAESMDGPFVDRLSQLARAHGLAIACGIFEVGDGTRVYNTVAVVGPDGDLLGAYRKIHLYDAFAFRESTTVLPGPGAALMFELGGTRFGVMTCYDVRFPELARLLSTRGAEAVILPAAWVAGPLKDDHWDVLVRARAIENTVYVLACAQAGSGRCGASMLVDPMGVAIARAGEVEQLIVGDLSGDRLAEVRKVNPSLRNRRIAVGTPVA